MIYIPAPLYPDGPIIEVCGDCGSVVVDVPAHEAWHQRIVGVR